MARITNNHYVLSLTIPVVALLLDSKATGHITLGGRLQIVCLAISLVACGVQTGNVKQNSIDRY